MVVYNEIEDVGPFHYGPIKKTYSISDAEISQVVSGPLRSSFNLSGNLGEHRLSLSCFLFPHAHRLSFRSEIQSQGGSGHFMTTLGLPHEGSLHADVDFGVEERDLSKISYGPVERLRENVFFGNHWTDWSDGQAGITLLGTTGEKGYQYFPEQNLLTHFLLMTIADAPPHKWERFITSYRSGRGRHVFDYQFLLHAGDWEKGNVYRRALEARHPLRVAYPEDRNSIHKTPSRPRRSLMQVSPRQVQFSAFYRDQGRYLLRVFETGGDSRTVSITLPLEPQTVEEVDFNGMSRSRAIELKKTQVQFEIKPWEIVTLAFDP